MRVSVLLALLCCAPPCLAANASWELPNFSDRIGIVVQNPGAEELDRVIVLDMRAVCKLASTFPGTLAIAAEATLPTRYVPSQADDTKRTGKSDEFALEVRLHPHEKKTIYIYYSLTLHDELPAAKRVYASHRYGYNQATAAIESEKVGYRTYGGFFFDVQAHKLGESGLFNSWLGYARISDPPHEGQDVIHLGNTLGLGGLFLRSGTDVYRPPLNTPDYAHRAAQPEEPTYRILATGPLRAVVEATLPRWTIGSDTVSLRALYEMRAGEQLIHCEWWVEPVSLSRTFEVGAGIRELPGAAKLDEGNIVITSGTQELKVGALALGLTFDSSTAHRDGTLTTGEGGNQVITFTKQLSAKTPVHGMYAFAAGWSGSGNGDVIAALKAAIQQDQIEPTIQLLAHETNPEPKRLEGEPI